MLQSFTSNPASIKFFNVSGVDLLLFEDFEFHGIDFWFLGWLLGSADAISEGFTSAVNGDGVVGLIYGE